MGWLRFLPSTRNVPQRTGGQRQVTALASALGITAAPSLALAKSPPRLERFTPPFYDGNPGAWATRSILTGGAPSVITCVTSAPPADDVYLEYTREINKTTFFTGGVGFSRPGEDIDRLLGGSASVWRRWLVNLMVSCWVGMTLVRGGSLAANLERHLCNILYTRAAPRASSC